MNEWKSSKITPRLLFAFCRPQHITITDLLQREHLKILTQSDPPLVEFRVVDIRCDRMVKVWPSAIVTMGGGRIGNHHHHSFQCYD